MHRHARTHSPCWIRPTLTHPDLTNMHPYSHPRPNTSHSSASSTSSLAISDLLLHGGPWIRLRDLRIHRLGPCPMRGLGGVGRLTGSPPVLGGNPSSAVRVTLSEIHCVYATITWIRWSRMCRPSASGATPVMAPRPRGVGLRVRGPR